MSTQLPRKSDDEISELKRQWQNDPCWDIEDTEGFEAHSDELKAWREQLEANWQARENSRLAAKAEHFGCSVELVRHLESLLRRIEELEGKK